MNSFRLEMRLGSLLYLGIIVFAMVLRFIHLGSYPLTDDESLSALRAAQGTTSASDFYVEPSKVVAQPSYEILTRIGFQIFGANDFLARLVPALAGAALVLTPLLARRKLGWGQTILIGFLLAVCPVFVTIARTASGSSLSAFGAMTFIMAILGLEEENKRWNPMIAGIGLGLCLASGPIIFTAILSLGIGLLIWRLIGFQSFKEFRLDSFSWECLRQIGWVAVVTIFIVSTGLGFFLDGIAGLFESVAFWTKGWSLGSPYASITLLLMIPVYMPVLLLLGIFGGWTSFRERDKKGLFASILAVVGLIVIMIYPGRQPHDLIWIGLPYAFLGAKYLVVYSHYIFEGRINLWVIAVAVIIILFTFMMYLQLSSTAHQDQIIDPVVSWMTLLGFLTVVVVILSFFGLGWDWTSARLSMILASLILVIILGVSALWRLNFGSQLMKANELWRSKVPSAGMGLLLETITTTSQASTGTDHALSIELIGRAPYSLIWALRDFQSSEGILVDENRSSPLVLVSKLENNLTLQDDYIGQTIAIEEEWGWDSALPPELVKWWIIRQPPKILDEWLILVRQDLVTLDED
jgi:hypothetical protein